MITRLDRITVGVAALGAHDPVLSSALDLARESGTELHAVHVHDSAPAVWAVGPAGRSRPVPRQERQTIRTRLEEHVRRHAGDARPICHVVEGTPSEELIRISAEVGVDLLVMGTTRRDRVGRHYLGTTAHGVVSHATRPVLLLRQPIVRPLRRVLVLVDLSDMSAAVLASGMEIVHELFRTDAPEHECLFVLEVSWVTAGDGLPFLEAAEEHLKHFLQPWSEGNVRVRGRLREGDPVEQIAEELDTARPDLLVMGTHSHRERRHGLGSVAGGALREARCNLLVIPAIHAEARLRGREGGAGRIPLVSAPERRDDAEAGSLPEEGRRSPRAEAPPPRPAG